jgi:UDP-N-acetylmuramoyl-tripeptide--D-alanyl-D-alanine ligase
MKSSLAALQPWISSAVVVNNAATDAAFDGVSTDSRQVSIGNLFVALRGERFDAHDFLNDVAARGVAAVVVDRVPDGLTVPALVVPDTRIALGEIGAYWRRQFKLPVIGVTGSNGKTTVKEMVASILSAAFGADNMLATRGNLNNDIGVPLTVFRLNASYQAAVIELGMNHPGEIAAITAIAQPTVGLVNNAQREKFVAHFCRPTQGHDLWLVKRRRRHLHISGERFRQ